MGPATVPREYLVWLIAIACPKCSGLTRVFNAAFSAGENTAVADPTRQAATANTSGMGAWRMKWLATTTQIPAPPRIVDESMSGNGRCLSAQIPAGIPMTTVASVTHPLTRAA